MNMSRRAFLFCLCLTPSPLAAQGFDCGKAQTPIENLICTAPELGALDRALNVAVQERLIATPQERTDFLVDSRRWLSMRDQTCAISAGPLSTERRAAAVSCLAKAYRARLDALAGSTLEKTTVGVDKTLCHRFVETYRNALSAQANDSGKLNTLLNQSPFAFLASRPNSGVVRAPEATSLPETNARQIDQWGQSQKPPVRLSKKLRREILGLGSTAILNFEHAPQTNFYVASQVQGTAHCIYAVAFVIRNGVAERVAKPLWPDQPGDSCGVDQFFGVIDGRTVAVQDNESPYEASLAARLSIKAWSHDAFGPACSVSFDYNPTFADITDDMAQEPDRKCDNAACIALRPEAKTMVEAIQKDPLAARKDAIERLSPIQRTTFAAMEKLAREKIGDIPAPDQPANPAGYLDQNPLLAPLLHQGEVYLASIGHYTIGWRVYPDWSVKLDKLDHDQLTTIGTASVAMRRGTLRAATVE